MKERTIKQPDKQEKAAHMWFGFTTEVEIYNRRILDIHIAKSMF